MKGPQLAGALSFMALGVCLVVLLISFGRMRAVSLVEVAGPEDVNIHLRASSNSIAWMCGGKEVADVCLLSAETCVASMQKKVDYTVAQSIARDVATCSCFQNNGCSASCNTAMMSTLGGYVSISNCGLDSSSAFVYSTSSPYEIYGDAYDTGYHDAYYPFATVGNFYKSDPGAAQQLREMNPKTSVYAVPVGVRMMRGRKV